MKTITITISEAQARTFLRGLKAIDDGSRSDDFHTDKPADLHDMLQDAVDQPNPEQLDFNFVA